jgi:5'-nucleotidase
MKNGGCHPVDGCQVSDPFGGAIFRYLTANVFYVGTNNRFFAYKVVKVNATIAFIGLTLEAPRRS